MLSLATDEPTDGRSSRAGLGRTTSREGPAPEGAPLDCSPRVIRGPSELNESLRPGSSKPGLAMGFEGPGERVLCGEELGGKGRGEEGGT